MANAKFLISLSLILLIGSFKLIKCEDQAEKLLILTVATEETDGYNRFIRSTKTYSLDVEVLGLHQKWEGGDVQRTAGGGHKVNLLKEAMEKYKDKDNLVVMFVDSYDVIFTNGKETILNKFKKSKAKVVFSAEGFCWPDKTLAEKYPKADNGKPYLNSGACADFSYTGFMGYAPQIYEIITSSDIANLEDDQLFYTKIYLNEDLRKKWMIKLDHKADIFQNLNGAVGDVELKFTNGDGSVFNTAYGTNPIVIHGNGLSKVALNSLGNYLAKSWTPKDGCLICKENTISLSKLKVKDMPKIVVGLFIEKPTPFLPEFFDRITQISYPKERIDLFLHNTVTEHVKDVELFLKKHKHKYNNIKFLNVEDEIKEWHARNLALEECMRTNCDYYFSVDSEAQITNPLTLRYLIEQNRTVIGPKLIRPNKLWSNFWGALSMEEFYARSHDYVDIVQDNRRGLWNVPFISTCYLVHGSLLKNKDTYPSYIHGLLDPDMAFCKNVRDRGIFMYISNVGEYGHLTNPETFDISLLHSEMHEIYSNQLDWELRYIHENYSKNFEPDHVFEQPCPDVFWFPVVSEIFSQHLIDLMENFGQWSAGTNYDPRVSGGYENVPTRDIHMNQIGMEQQWLYFLREYIRPIQEKIFIGYFHDPPKAAMNFVVRYKPDEQASLRPHHDASTYTINIALNTKDVDYEGGGCRFIRYNCSVVDLRLGWSLIHPGRLTHYHEGLRVTKGIRYIMISFVDP